MLSKKDRYVIKLPLQVSQKDARRLDSRLEVGRLIYNAALREIERRRLLYVEHPACLKALTMKGTENKEKRIELYKEARKAVGYYWRAAAQHGLTDSLEAYVHKVILGDSWLCQHYSRHEASELCKRAFDASVKVATKQAKSVHFKGRGRDYITSAAGTSLASGLTWKDGKLRWGRSFLLTPEPWVFEDEKYKSVLEHYAAQEVLEVKLPKRCITQARLVRRLVFGEWRYYAYLVCVGKPVQKAKHALGVGKIGLDLGPRNFAQVTEQGDDGVTLLTFCGELGNIVKYKRRLERRLDRQRRANNPQNYNPDGTARKKAEIITIARASGTRVWKWSVAMKETQGVLVELARKEAEHRRCLHGKLINILRSIGDHVCLEDLTYKSWQQGRYGKSVGKHAPAMFVQLLKQKFNFTGGMVDELNTRVLKLSQRCPMCDRVAKKKLSERVHRCECGYEMQRDLVSALLAICTDNEGTNVQADKAKKLCQERGPLLQAAWDKRNGQVPSLRADTPARVRVRRLRRCRTRG